MRIQFLVPVIGAFFLAGCAAFADLGSLSERAIAIKDIANSAMNTICERPEDDTVRVDIRDALARVSAVDSRVICTEGVDHYLNEVIKERFSKKDSE